jgi:hypothetical protein
MFLIAGCFETVAPPPEEEPYPEETSSEEDTKAWGLPTWTVIVYMAADNNLYPYALQDLWEMVQSGIGSKDRVNVVVLLDGGEETKCYYLQEGRLLDIWVQVGNENSGDGSTLANFIQFVKSGYPATRYALILWDHGAGWRDPAKGICVDDTANDIIEIPELAQALRSGGIHFDLIGMDACLMAMIEVAYEIRDCGDILVASQASEPAYGWDYYRIFRRLAQSPSMSPTALALEIVRSYFSYYGSGSITLSVIRLSRVNALVWAINDFLTLLRAESSSISMNRVISPCWFYIDEGRGYADIYNFAQWLIYELGYYKPLKSALRSVQAKLRNAVYYNRAGGYYRGAKGLSIHLPYYCSQCPQGSPEYRDLAFAQDTLWDEFLEEVWCYSCGG